MTARPRRRRGVTITVILLVALAALWSGYWYAASRTAHAALARATTAAASRGVTLDCKQGSVGGYPLWLDLACPQAKVDRAVGGEVSGAVSGVTVSVPLYWPGHVEAVAGGPMVVDAPALGVALSASWSSARAIFNAGLSGIKGGSIDVTGFNLTNGGESRRLPIKQVSATHFNFIAEPAGANDYAISGQAEKLQVAPADGTPLPTVDGTVHLTALKLGNGLGTDPRKALRDWFAGGGTLQIDQMSVTIGAVSIDASGTLTASSDGLLSGKLTTRFIGLDRLPDIVDKIRPGHRNDVENAVKVLGAVTTPVATDKGEARQTVIVIHNGLVAVGIFPVGMIPPIRF